MPERPLDPEFSKRLKSLMDKHGIKNNNQFAARIGKFSSATLEWVNGRVPANPKDWKLLSDFFGVDLDYLLLGIESPPKVFSVSIEASDKDKKVIEAFEGKRFTEKLVPIPIAKDSISAGSPREVREDPDGVAVIYKDWCRNPQNFTVVRVRGESMHPTIQNGSLVGIDHSKRDPKKLNGKIVALREDGKATIKRLRLKPPDMVLGIPDNHDMMDEIIVLRGNAADEAIIGQVVWGWNLWDK